jgi:hypothetical protein
MKNQVTRLVTIGIALAASVAVHAQDKTISASVPFSFYMGSTLMPQGTYRVNEFAQGSVVWVNSGQSDASKGVTTINVNGKKQVEPARLVFHCYGQNYFLAEIWTGDSSAGRALARSPREKELAKSGAEVHVAMVEVYANR